MRYLLLSIMVVGVLFCSSCSDDDDLPAVPSDDLGQLELNFRLTYDGGVTPIVDEGIFVYPDTDLNYFINRVSFFLSELTFGDASVEGVQLVHFDSQFGDADRAEEGLSILVDRVNPGTYQGLTYSLGLTPEVNATMPADYTSDNPLSSLGEYWDAWSSYIFTKVEGQIDTIRGDQFSESFALHCGSDEALTPVSFDDAVIMINGNQKTVVQIDFDINRFFVGQNEPYDILAPGNNRIHHLNQIEQIKELSTNWRHAMSISDISMMSL